MVFLTAVRYVAHAAGVVVGFLLGLPYVGRFCDVFLAFCASVARLGAGSYAASGLPPAHEPRCARRTGQPIATAPPGIVLYEFEGCPFCRRVREALCALDLDFVAYPCPRETMKQYGFSSQSRHRPSVKEAGGQLVFPYLVDHNTGVAMYESKDIVRYLWAEYGGGGRPHITDRVANLPIVSIGNFLASAFRPLGRMGMLRTPSRAPEQPLELWNMEGSPFCRIAREALCTLELPYICHSVPHGAPRNRAEFKRRFGARHLSRVRKALGAVKVPFLVDPNTGVEMSESADIVSYLNRTYKLGETVQESLLDYSTKGASKAHMTIR